MPPILWPMLAQIGWTMLLYVWLTVVRKQAMQRGEADVTTFILGRDEPPAAARVARNLSNQFELPVIFYALVVLLIVLDRVTTLDIVAAWIFVAGRVLHSLVQNTTDNVPLRGQVFTINFLALVAIFGHVVWLGLSG